MPASAKRKAARQLKFGLSPTQATIADSTEHKAPSKSKTKSPSRSRSRSRSRSPSDNDSSVNGAGNSDKPDGADVVAADPAEATAATTTSKTKTKEDTTTRYILFVGNLPFDATTAGVEKHFAPMKPTQVRHRTDKVSGRSRGFAFVEFNSHARMDACLTRYHRSEYVEHAEDKAAKDGAEDADANEPPDLNVEKSGEWQRPQREGKKGARRINVQLTAGGGGKSDVRRKRLREKNEKLDRERQKRRKRALEKKATKAERSASAEKMHVPALEAEEEEGMHPSRRARFARK